MTTKKFFTAIFLSLSLSNQAQVLLNEVYTDPGGNKHEFFELYNTNTSSSPEVMDNYTMVTFFEFPGSNGEVGFYVMDMPNLSLAPKGYFVGSAAIPFNCQGITNSTASDFDWNSTSLTSNGGYLKKWVNKTNNLSDGNPGYDEGSLPNDFNDFFFRRTGVGASYTIFLYKNGVLVNAVIFGTGGYTEVIPVIISLPKLHIDMSGSSTDFDIDFSTYGTVLIENVNQDAGSDNGYIREADGKCGAWLKSSAQVQHTPKQTNGTVDGDDGVIAVSTIINKGSAAAGSVVTYDVLSAPVTSFPISLEVYNDHGTTQSSLDGGDLFIDSNTESVVSDGPFSTTFTPNTAHILIVVKSNLGCIDKVLFVPNVSILPVKLISFQGSINNKNAALEWQVASNEQAYKFEVEKSIDGKNFENTSLVAPSGRNGNETYKYNEATGYDKIYYRLKITDRNSMVTYSKVLAFSNETNGKEKLNILGTNVTDKLTLSFQSQLNQSAEINVLDIAGKLVLKQNVKMSKGNNLLSFSLPVSMNNGMYVASLAGNNFTLSAQFIKQ